MALNGDSLDAGESFSDMLARLAEGDNDAAAHIFDRFAKELVRRARNRMQPQVMQKLDPEDVVQSVFRSFFRRHAEGQFELEGWDSLLGLLVRITLRKCGRQTASLKAACRDLTREVAPNFAQQSNGATSWEAVSREPTPLETVTFTELVENIMVDLSPRDREMLVLRLQGYSTAEISERVGRTERTVHRAFAAIKEKLDRVSSLT